MNSATITLFLDSRRKKRNGKYPVKLTVYYQDDKKRYGTGIDLTEDEWSKINAPKLKAPELKEFKLRLDALIFEADEIIKDLKIFSFKEFENAFLGANKKRKKDSFFELFQEYTKQLKSQGQYDIAAEYEKTLQLLKEFRAVLYLNQVNARFLEEFEKYIKEKGGISDLITRVHLRNIKSVIIYLIAKGELHHDKSPFNILFELFEVYKEDLQAEGRIGTAGLFRYTLNTLMEMRGNLQLLHVTPDFLKEFENYCKYKGNSDTTTGIHFRNIRAVINVAIKKGLFPQDSYPFKGFTIPSGQNIKKAFDDKSLAKLLKYTPKNDNQQKALDFWIFSYLGNGMNMKDIALLQKDNVDEDFFHFKRAKTIRTRKKDTRPIKVAIHPKAKKIIEKWKSDDNNPYLFPILEPGLSSVTIQGRVQRFLKFVNKNMKEIIQQLNIELGPFRKPGTMAARHSFATKLRRKGVPDNEIGELLGHTDPKTTKNYFDSFPDEHLRKRSKLLL